MRSGDDVKECEYGRVKDDEKEVIKEEVGDRLPDEVVEIPGG